MSKAGKRQPAHVVTVWWHGCWLVDIDDTEQVMSAYSAKKSIVVAAARGIAKVLRAELVIRDKRGRIRQRDSYGHDPRSRKG